jgi:type I restriction enzyme, S subunit
MIQIKLYILFESLRLLIILASFCKSKKRAFRGFGRLTLIKRLLRTTPIPLAPSLAIQNAIVTAIEARLSKAELLEKVVEENLNKAEQLKQSILKKAFLGELV